MKSVCKFLVNILLCFLLFGCNDDLNNALNDKGLLEYQHDIEKCGVLGVQDVGTGVYVGAVSKDKKILICFLGSNSPFIFRLDENQNKIEQFNFESANTTDSSLIGSLRYPVFCPYDQNIILFLTGVRIKTIDEQFGYETTKIVPQWCLYNLENKTLKKLTFNNPIIEQLTQHSFDREIVYWSSSSTPGNDIFYLSNFKMFHLQSGKIEESRFVKPNTNSLLLLSGVSPDEKKYFSILNGNEIYLNTTRLSQLHIIKDLERNYGVHWSVDSKYFSAQVPIFYNSYTSVLGPGVYKLNDDNSISLDMSLNLLKKHCSFPNGFPGCPVFLSDTSYAYSLYPNLSYYGDLYEFNKKGDVIRRLTNFFN